MKILILLLLIPLSSFAQTVHYDDATAGNVPVSQTYPLPVQAAEGEFKITSLGDTALIWATDTLVSTNADTVSKFAYYTLSNLNTMFKNYFRFTITADSTIQISTSASFTTGLTFTVNTGESWTPPHTFLPSKVTNLYIKKGSAITGVTTWRAELSGR